MPASDYRIDGTETKDYVLDDTSFDIAVGETTKISLDSQSTQGRSFSDGVIKMIRKNKTNILLLAIVAIGMAVVKKKKMTSKDKKVPEVIRDLFVFEKVQCFFLEGINLSYS